MSWIVENMLCATVILGVLFFGVPVLLKNAPKFKSLAKTYINYWKNAISEFKGIFRKRKAKTHYEQVKEMSIEEMVEFIKQIEHCAYSTAKGCLLCGSCHYKGDICPCTHQKEWLESEVKNNEKSKT